MRRLKRSSIQKTTVHIDGLQVPATIYREERNGYRYSIGKNGAYLRMPFHYDRPLQKKLRAEFELWVQDQFTNQAGLKQRFFGKDYKDGDQLQVGNHSYRLNIQSTQNKTHSALLEKNTIFLKITELDSGVSLQKAIKTLLSRVIAKHQLPEIVERVNYWNKLHFQKPIKKVSLKYNVSNWGSCSARGNINLSTRLLFAPKAVIDYVIIHELAHLIEMNHSPAFWAIVSKAMPDYLEKEEWLKKNGHLCNF